MSEMVERVALAISEVPFRLPGAGGLRGELRLAPAQAREIARAAIEAMREPTEVMERAGAESMRETEGFGLEQQSGLIFNAMIAAALAEAPR